MNVQTVVSSIQELLTLGGQLTIPPTNEVIEKHLDRYLWFQRGDEIVGCVAVRQLSWFGVEIKHLAVHPTARRQGVATALMDMAESRARTLLRKRGVIIVITKQNNDAIARLNIKRGYSEVLLMPSPLSSGMVRLWMKSCS